MRIMRPIAESRLAARAESKVIDRRRDSASGKYTEKGVAKIADEKNDDLDVAYIAGAKADSDRKVSLK